MLQNMCLPWSAGWYYWRTNSSWWDQQYKGWTPSRRSLWRSSISNLSHSNSPNWCSNSLLSLVLLEESQHNSPLHCSPPKYESKKGMLTDSNAAPNHWSLTNPAPPVCRLTRCAVQQPPCCFLSCLPQSSSFQLSPCVLAGTCWSRPARGSGRQWPTVTAATAHLCARHTESETPDIPTASLRVPRTSFIIPATTCVLSLAGDCVAVL